MSKKVCYPESVLDKILANEPNAEELIHNARAFVKKATHKMDETIKHVNKLLDKLEVQGI